MSAVAEAGRYIGRFAPSPTGPLHAGSLVAALASWLDARAHGGSWLVRIEDVDLPRCVPGADQLILQQLASCGLIPDAPPVYQSQRGALYQAALDQLVANGHAYPCGCTRADIAQANATLGLSKPRHGDLVYPGTCRPERGGLQGKPARAWRLQVPDAPHDLITWQDRRLGPQHQHLASAVGDFVIKRADGLWAYQLAVVVDDAAQGVTHIVRGADLCDNTPRQILLQRWLGLPTPRYLHTPLVLGDNGEKLSKQNGARALDLSSPQATLQQAGRALGLVTEARGSVADWLAQAVRQWPFATPGNP
ncbi:tRNA glutamyl-Q(34) synthetase GluQRS [Aquabacterium sp. NJ1]|uniref:tRNA glutamyl-Q(34) synthetase GluQRS n=1 Tax=Aquabacterium sp. NJ1 TaxID=1538295 RepID=UPI0009E08E2C|nr:tRNA glutamyl-Q(34) synthetase GluQRS [Aquabacterium sp. NJ1]